MPSADLINSVPIQWGLTVICQTNLTKFVIHNHFLSLAIFTICLPALLSLPSPSINFSTTCVHVSVLWPSEVVRDAGEAPARLHLPASRPLEEGAPVHSHPAHLSGAALGHQDLTCCYHLPNDGELSTANIPALSALVNSIQISLIGINVQVTLLLKLNYILLNNYILYKKTN